MAQAREAGRQCSSPETFTVDPTFGAPVSCFMRARSSASPAVRPPAARELARCLAGVLSPDSGTIEVTNSDGRKMLAASCADPCWFRSRRPKTDGIFPDLDVVDNIDVSRLTHRRNPLVTRRLQLRSVIDGFGS